MTERELLGSTGLTPLEVVDDPRLPDPARAWSITAGVAEPTVAVPLAGDGLAGRVDAEWLSVARLNSLVGEEGEFLISPAGSRAWTRVRLTGEPHLAEHLTGGRPGEAEFVTMACDGSVMCGVTTEEYAVWVVVDRQLLHTAPGPAPAADPSTVDLSTLGPLQRDKLFSPGRLTGPYRDGWVLLGFNRKARYLARLHELPDGFGDADAAALAGDRTGRRELTDDQARALAVSVGLPVETDRLAYYLEYQTGTVKSQQSTTRRMPPRAGECPAD